MEGNREIIRLKGDVNYTKLLTHNGEMVKHSSYTLKKELRNYPSFIRVGRGDAVAIDKIDKVNTTRRVLVLVDGSVIKISREKIKSLKEQLDERKFL